MEYVEELINRTKKRISMKEAYILDKEITKFLNDKAISKKQKIKLKNEGLIEPIAMLSDGYKKQNKLEHYSTQK